MSFASEPLTFRAAQSADAEAVADLVNAAYRSLGGPPVGAAGASGWTHEAELLAGPRADPEGLRQLMGRPYSRLELALQGELVGSVHLQTEDGQCHLGLLAILPARQTTGLGRQVLEHSEELARSWGCRGMCLTVIQFRTELMAYYQRRGYHASGRRLPFPYEDPGVGVPRVPGMELIEMVKSLA